LNIIFGEEQREKIGDKYIVLPLDKVGVKGEYSPTQLYAILGSESITLGEMPVLEQTIELHKKLIENYVKADWNFCEQALTHLKGKFGGEIDSFYNILETRIREYKINGLPPEWDGTFYNNNSF